MNFENISESEDTSNQIKIFDKKISVMEENNKEVNNQSSSKKLKKNVLSNHRHYVSKFEESENIFDIVS